MASASTHGRSLSFNTILSIPRFFLLSSPLTMIQPRSFPFGFGVFTSLLLLLFLYLPKLYFFRWVLEEKLDPNS